MTANCGARRRRAADDMTEAMSVAATEDEQRRRERCPRCESRDTKFCYYNNYNTAQPRHFCRSCRRYWTLGGSLRDVPIGGSTRKRLKPSRAEQPAQPAQLQPPPPPPLLRAAPIGEPIFGLGLGLGLGSARATPLEELALGFGLGLMVRSCGPRCCGTRRRTLEAGTRGGC
uniref:Dof zinc finger protein n=1 Tax=Ananas comosus var. bracteatus TaxID=296719 RepID=A0A6V7PBK0_ANACO|nr:unnamed protein product [Ananas comosus var. bracteatus]